MKSIIILATVAMVAVAGYAAQDTTLDGMREVRDPVQLKAWLEANAGDAETRIAAVEGVVGTDGNVTLANGKTLKAIHDGTTNTLVTSGKLAAGELSGNVAQARIATALAAPGAIGGTTPAAGAFTTLTATGTTTLAAALSGAVQATAGVISAGTLPVASGGTGAATLTGVLKGNGTGAVTAAAQLAVADGGTGLSSGTSGGILAYTAAGTLASSAALAQYGIVLGGGAGAVPATLAASANTGAPLLSAGAAANPSYGPLNLAGGATIVTGTLPVASGGTGAATVTGLVKGNGTGAFSAAVAGTDYVAPSSVWAAPELAMTTTNTPAGTFVVTAQAKTVAGGDLSDRRLLRIYTSTTEYGAPSDSNIASITPSLGSGSAIEVTANAHYYYVTAAAGTATFTVALTGDGTNYLHVVDGASIAAPIEMVATGI